MMQIFEVILDGYGSKRVRAARHNTSEGVITFYDNNDSIVGMFNATLVLGLFVVEEE